MAITGVVPHLVVHDASAASAFYQKAFGATETMRMPEDHGTRLMHAQLAFGSASVYLCDDFPEYCDGKTKAPVTTGHATAVTVHLSVSDVDAAFAQATAAGATVVMPPMDMFWGDRYAKLLDPFGHEWSLSHPLSAERKAAAEVEWEKMKANWAKK